MARGRVLDVGCGAGRHALALQARGLDVVGIDASPFAIKTARARGLKRVRLLRIENVSPALGTFDTVLMSGNNFGLFGNFQKARRLLVRFHRMTSPAARIIAESNDIYATTNPLHLAYQRHNRRRGRMSGQIRFRVRYYHYATKYYDYLMVSPAEMRQIAKGTGWHVARVLPSPGSTYFAVLEKDPPATPAKPQRGGTQIRRLTSGRRTARLAQPAGPGVPPDGDAAHRQKPGTLRPFPDAAEPRNIK